MTQLLECLNDWTRNFDGGHQTDVIYSDFAKALDTVPHQRLIWKLKQAGVRGRVVSWVESFLRNRRQRVDVNQTESSLRSVYNGIQQDSVLGPTLYLV